jgi:hypothetical protein
VFFLDRQEHAKVLHREQFDGLVLDIPLPRPGAFVFLQIEAL